MKNEPKIEYPMANGLFDSLAKYNDALDIHGKRGHVPEFKVQTHTQDRNGVLHYCVRIDCQKCGLTFEDARPEQSIVYRLLNEGFLMPILDKGKLGETLQWINSIRAFSFGDVIDLSGMRRCPTCLQRLLILQAACFAPNNFVAMWNCTEWSCSRGHAIYP